MFYIYAQKGNRAYGKVLRLFGKGYFTVFPIYNTFVSPSLLFVFYPLRCGCNLCFFHLRLISSFRWIAVILE